MHATHVHQLDNSQQHTQSSHRVAPDAIGANFVADVKKMTSPQGVGYVLHSDPDHTLRRERHLAWHTPWMDPMLQYKVDPAPWFRAIREDKTLDHFRISSETGRVKKPNQNPVAVKALSELENERLKQEPGGGPVSPLSLGIALARLKFWFISTWNAHTAKSVNKWSTPNYRQRSDRTKTQ